MNVNFTTTNLYQNRTRIQSNEQNKNVAFGKLSPAISDNLINIFKKAYNYLNAAEGYSEEFKLRREVVNKLSRNIETVKQAPDTYFLTPEEYCLMIETTTPSRLSIGLVGRSLTSISLIFQRMANLVESKKQLALLIAEEGKLMKQQAVKKAANIKPDDNVTQRLQQLLLARTRMEEEIKSLSIIG